MIRWVLYDIGEDRARNRVAKTCLRAGLYRVQYSVFLGSLSPTEFDELRLAVEDEVDPDRDKVYLFTMSKRALQSTVLLGQAFDKKLVTDQVRALFL